MAIEQYNNKSCNALEKPYYKPIEVALGWCILIEYEVEILQKSGRSIIPDIVAFKQ